MRDNCIFLGLLIRNPVFLVRTNFQWFFAPISDSSPKRNPNFLLSLRNKPAVFPADSLRNSFSVSFNVHTLLGVKTSSNLSPRAKTVRTTLAAKAFEKKESFRVQLVDAIDSSREKRHLKPTCEREQCPCRYRATFEWKEEKYSFRCHKKHFKIYSHCEEFPFTFDFC